MIFPARNLHLFWGFSMAMLVITRWYKPTHIPVPRMRNIWPNWWPPAPRRHRIGRPRWPLRVCELGRWFYHSTWASMGSMWSLVVYHVPGLTLINYTTFYPTKLGDLADSSSNRVVVHTGGLPSPIWLAKKCHDPASLWAFCKSRWVV